MLTFRLNERSDFALLLLVVTASFFHVSSVVAQVPGGNSRTVTTGETFTVNLPVKSSFHQWKLSDYDVRKLSLISMQPADTIGDYRFQFEALELGQTELVFEQNLSTAISSELLQQRTITVSIKNDADGDTEAPAETQSEITPANGGETPPPANQDQENVQPSPDDQESPTGEQNGSDFDWTAWNEVQELLETEHYEKARSMIQDRAGQSAGRARQRWKELEAKSHMQQEQYQQAITIWENLLDEFQNGPQAKWLLSIADAHRKNDAPDQAELALLEIRHRHRGTPQWPTAMKKLAAMALQQNNVERARKVLESARSRLSERNHPDILMQLAEVYDKFPPTRNYYKAVKLYQTAARRFDASDTRSEVASNRADYLRNNFLDFGIQ